MDNENYNAGEAANEAVHNAQAQVQQAGEQGIATAKALGENWRSAMEKSLHEMRARYAKTKGALDEAAHALQVSVGAATEGVTHFNAKAIEAIKADTEANFDLLASMASAKSLPDLVTLNTEFVRKRFEEATARAKAYSEFARKVADESAAPLREQLAKTFKFTS